MIVGMNLFLLSVVSVIGISAVLWVCGGQTLKTLALIVRISPYERSVPGGPTILILGDSTGYGTGTRTNTNSIAGRIGADFSSYSIENNSKNGRAIGELVPVAQSVSGTYELILLQIGGNDILQKRNAAAVEAELRTIVETLSDHTEHLVMISTGNVGAASVFHGEEAVTFERITRDFRVIFNTVAADTQLTFVDLFVERDVDPFVRDPETYLAFDGLHPSDAGYGAWYETLHPTLEGVLMR